MEWAVPPGGCLSFSAGSQMEAPPGEGGPKPVRGRRTPQPLHLPRHPPPEHSTNRIPHHPDPNAPGIAR
jgi:hypothetical protein